MAAFCCGVIEGSLNSTRYVSASVKSCFMTPLKDCGFFFVMVAASPGCRSL